MRRIITINLNRFSSSIKSHYQVLGVKKEASQQDIKSAYYKLAKQYHPDLHPQHGDRFKEVNEAYNILKDPLKKYDYDNLFSKVAGKENISEVNKSHYNTHFHYGYTNKLKKGEEDKIRYESNPFGSNYNKVFSNEFTRNMFRKQNDTLRKQNLTNMNNSVKNTLIAIFSLFFILFMTEMMLDLYEFNHEKQKTISNRAKDVY